MPQSPSPIPQGGSWTAWLQRFRGGDGAIAVLVAWCICVFAYLHGAEVIAELWPAAEGTGRRVFYHLTAPADRLLDPIRDRPPLLRAFLQQFPKGGNLHVHLSGAIYVERLIDMAKSKPGLDKLCVTGEPVAIVSCGLSNDAVTLADLVNGRVGWDAAIKAKLPAELRGSFPLQRLIDALSMRNFDPAHASSADQFFGSFSVLGPLASPTEAMIKELADAGNAQGLRYIEVMVSLQDYVVDPAPPPSSRPKQADCIVRPKAFQLDKCVDATLGERGIVPPKDWAAKQDMVEIEKALVDLVRQRAEDTAKALDQNGLGSCSDPACAVDIRFVQQLIRERPPIAFYTQLLFARELLRAQQPLKIKRVVGVNIVAPEHGPGSRAGDRAQMALIRALCDPPSSPCHGRLSLHAGELVIGLVPPADLQFHIREAVDAGARRIGHGVAIGFEATEPGGKPFGLLDRMAQQRVAVEINLGSNKGILGVAGREHPLRDYMAFAVPVVLSTDDEGVSRSDVTNEWLQAVRDQGLSYRDLVRLARDSLEYSFLDGDSLWEPPRPGVAFADHRRGAACRRDRPTTSRAALTKTCRELLEHSEKASHQWGFEAQLAAFEAQGWGERLGKLDRSLAAR